MFFSGGGFLKRLQARIDHAFVSWRGLQRARSGRRMSADASGRMLSRLSGLSRAFIASAADETAYYMAEGESRLSREVDQNVAQAPIRRA